MLIIEIHVDTIENAESAPSTQLNREDERLTKENKESNSTGNRFWNAIKVSIPGSFVQKMKTKDE